jgi:hypothetical protein
MERIADTFLHLVAWFVSPDRRDERGDVPGWVMITVMTVGIVGAIWAVARDELTQMLKTALRSVGAG